jgi:hypothetical protein
MSALGFELVVNTPTEFAARIKADIAKWAGVIEAAHIKAPQHCSRPTILLFVCDQRILSSCSNWRRMACTRR